MTEIPCAEPVTEHEYNESCCQQTLQLICTIPAHEHEASCIVKDLDLTADVDSAWQWEIAAKAADRTGDWAEDLLAVAKTQLGYQESSKNVALEGDDLKGYTYYGAKYGDPYGDRDALFVSFCLEYAGVKNFPAAGDAAQWRQQLEAQQMFAPLSGAFAPDNGDLIFVDADLDGEADRVGIAAEQVPGTDQWKLIVGDTENGCVEYITYALTDEVILGGCDLPENPMSQSYLDGLLAEEAFADLSEKADTLTYGDLNAVAETSVGNNWQLLRDSGWFEEYSRSALMFAANRYTMASGNASTPVIFAAGQPSDVQIRNEGGEAISDENAVYVSKTITGTDVENVFDITLDIVTQDIVTEVYKEPDMAVVIVMDIFQTMNSNFGSTTRYKAAMKSLSFL